MQGTQQHSSTTLQHRVTEALSLTHLHPLTWEDGARLYLVHAVTCYCYSSLSLALSLSLLLFLSLVTAYSRSQESVSCTKSLITTLTNVCCSSYSASPGSRVYATAVVAVVAAASAAVVIVTPRTLTLNVFCILTFVQVDNCDQQADKCYYCC